MTVERANLLFLGLALGIVFGQVLEWVWALRLHTCTKTPPGSPKR